ncbi:uncharacterized protein LTR77_003776 [Saxophila tyrrhenica]|uniref:FR47-like domain-containing protein n=1 Tax=Saxophila tyrrhenica TaxID=1690608 RepID=A0AAV9PH85_9PEZI|nr:hypothetical protein LTR77_003776 [Saxophila tyrrhenica]
MATPRDDIHSYSLTSDDSQQTINAALNILRPHIPVSLPLYRRLQFGRFFDATALLTNLNLDGQPNSAPNGTPNRITGKQEHNPQNDPWLLAFVDRSCRPETEVWLSASWDSQPSPPMPDQEPAIDALMTSLLQTLASLLIPPSIHAPAEAPANGTKDSVGLTHSDYATHASDPRIMLWGAIHAYTVPVLTRLGHLPRRFETSVMPNHCFIFDVPTLPAYEKRSLTPGLRWGKLGRQHFPLVRSRTQIPRQDRTLAVLPNLAIFEGDVPVAWAFIGLDASLSTLHVEEPYRGQGLAKALTTKLFREEMGRFWKDGGENLAHGYVIDGNKQSEGMCRSLGGKSGWWVYWLRVELGEGQS